MAFFDKNGDYIKKATYTYVKQGKYWYASHVIMEDLRKEHSTEITIKDITFDTGLTKDDFTIEILKGENSED
jgi:outer membrane lipoprotein-sorting protein